MISSIPDISSDEEFSFIQKGTAVFLQSKIYSQHCIIPSHTKRKYYLRNNSFYVICVKSLAASSLSLRLHLRYFLIYHQFSESCFIRLLVKLLLGLRKCRAIQQHIFHRHHRRNAVPVASDKLRSFYDQIHYLA